MRLHELSVGHDGRNRTLLSPFRAKSSRNQPSNARFVFGPAKWIRGLVKPPRGYGVAYVDWKTQEIGIAARLSGDLALQASYSSCDPYLDFGKRAGVLPPHADSESHGESPERALCKSVVLAINYGQTARGMADRIDKPECVTRELMRAHRAEYRQFWNWSDAVVDRALLIGSIRTVFGWTMWIAPSQANYGEQGSEPNSRSLMNFPMQANGAEMMRLAACLATERGLLICAPVHDAFLLIAPLDRLEADAEALRACMSEASRVVLDGFELGTDVKLIRYPERFMDKRGAAMWDKVTELLQRCELLQERGIA
jgi:DNA polymerase-1